MSRRAAWDRERGAVTVELALGIPLLLGVTLALAWMLALAVTQVRVVDAAREAARVVARGEDRGEAISIVGRVAPAGARVEVAADADEVRVVVSTTVEPPLGLGGLLGGPVVDATAVAVPEGVP